MDRDNFYFYTSGAISLTFFSLICSLFVFALFNADEIKNYALKKENFVSISLQSIEVPTTASKKPQKQPEIIEEPTPIVPPEPQKVEVSKPKPKEVNIDSLFSTVVTKDIKKDTKPQEKPVDKRVVENSAKKSKESNDSKKSLSKTLDSTLSDKKSEQTQKTSGGNEVNEYLAKIQAIIYENFYPPAATEGMVVKIAIEINSLGKVMSFRVVSYSKHEGLNQEVDRVASRIKNMVFPLNPDGKTQTHYINLISEDTN